GKRVFIADMFWLKYLIGERFVKTGKCGLRATNIELGAAYMSFAFRKQLRNKRVFESFNKGIRRFTEGSLQRHRLLTSTLYYEICTGESVAVTDPLKLVDLAGAFIIFTQDGAPPHWNLEVRESLNNVIPNRWIGHVGANNKVMLPWLPRLPDITPCDFFLWSFVKDKVYMPPLPRNLENLRTRIDNALNL
ncbi:hypothetical protein AVEN_150652-1, partial [Araneus ventricosus]